MDKIIESAAHAIQRAYFKANRLDFNDLEKDFQRNEQSYLQMAWAAMNTFRAEMRDHPISGDGQ